MSYCYEHAIPHSHFLGGPNQWETTDRMKAMAVALERSERCPSCGTAPWEWQADPSAYVAVKEQCRGCLIREAKQEDDVPQKGERISLFTRARAEEIVAHPELYVVDSPKMRRARKEQRRKMAAKGSPR